MSVSEKLAALERSMSRPWLTPAETGDPYDARCPVDHEGCQVWPWQEDNDMKGAYLLRNVLPQIRALVEAAEKLWQVHGEIAAWPEGTELITALAALDKALGEQT